MEHLDTYVAVDRKKILGMIPFVVPSNYINLEAIPYDLRVEYLFGMLFVASAMNQADFLQEVIMKIFEITWIPKLLDDPSNLNIPEIADIHQNYTNSYGYNPTLYQSITSEVPFDLDTLAYYYGQFKACEILVPLRKEPGVSAIDILLYNSCENISRILEL